MLFILAISKRAYEFFYVGRVLCMHLRSVKQKGQLEEDYLIMADCQ